jgi:lipopolysaccharide biosynthesis glycosyltransferase
MKNFFDWFNSDLRDKKKEWLIIGKGPSFSRRNEFDLSQYNIMALNHTVREIKTTLAHAIDFDVVENCVEEIKKNAEYLVMPLIPNVNNKPGNKTIHQLMEDHLFLKNMEGKILWYHLHLTDYRSDIWKDLISGQKQIDKYPIVPATYFSSEAAVNLLAMAGIKKMRTLGIDGGKSYSSTFDDLKDKTLLNNQQNSFDIQFASIAKTIMEKKLDYAPVYVEESPIRIFVGSQEEQMLSVKVLEYSIRKYCSMNVEVFPLFHSTIRYALPKDPKNKPRTPFSFQRFLIPQLKEFKGKGIYLDSDMQVFKDIKDLWTTPMENAEILSAYESSSTGRRPQFAVMLIDCEKLKWDINSIVKKLDSGEFTYEQLMYQMGEAKNIKPTLEKEWNSLEYFEEGKTCLLHYTDMDKQPWLFHHNPLAHVWFKELANAVNDGFISYDYIAKHILAGNVRPSIIYQVRKKKFDPLTMSAFARFFDSWFTPPHMKNEKTSRFKIRMNKVAANILIKLFSKK